MEAVKYTDSKQLMCILTVISCDVTYVDPLRRKAIDFFQLVNSQTLAIHLYQNNLITEDDFERVQLQNMTRSDRAIILYLKLIHLGKTDFEVFMNCLKDAANEHLGHKELYHKLSTQ